MLALTQRHLAARALHTAHHHLRHIAAVPVPGFLRFTVQMIANRQTCRQKQTQCINQEMICRGFSVMLLFWKTDVHDSLSAAHWGHRVMLSLWSLRDNNFVQMLSDSAIILLGFSISKIYQCTLLIYHHFVMFTEFQMQHWHEELQFFKCLCSHFPYPPISFSQWVTTFRRSHRITN